VKELKIGNGMITASEIALGVMRIADCEKKEASRLISAAIDEGIDFFDNAAVYEDGKCEEIFGQIVSETAGLREKMIIQTKCGILPSSFDSSKEHILSSVENSLKRLKTDYIDILLLHRPDALVEPGEVADAFDLLHSSGKVRYFGVSNHNSMQIELLSRYCNQRIMVNQLQLSIAHTAMIDAGLNVNMKNPPAVDRDGSIMDYCRLNDITIQAWSPFRISYDKEVFMGHSDYRRLDKKLDEIAKSKGTSASAIVIAWILRHPAGIQAIVGTMNANRLKEICKGSAVKLTREEWYGIYMAAGNELP